MIRAADLKDWIPIRVAWRDREPRLDWCYFGDEQFSDPFFSQTVEARLRSPSNLLFRHDTPLALAEELPAGLHPSGFIFHMSRCGSTLISQMLAALPGSLVISEAPPIDSILRAHLRVPSLTEEQHRDWLRWMIRALGQRQNREEFFFVKFDAWNTMSLPLIRSTFPNVPWIFVYRDPVEVLVSQERQRGAHMVPGVLDPALFGMDWQSAIGSTLQEYSARVLASICHAARDSHQAGGGKLVNYTELPDVVSNTLLSFFGVGTIDTDKDALREVSSRHAKNPSVNFERDSHSKQEAASSQIREAARTWIAPIYEELEMIRTGG